MPPTDLDALALENAELRRRIEAAHEVIDQLRVEAQQRRAEVRALAEALPAAVSRHAIVRQMVGEAVHHPDKRGVAARAARKLGRAPRKAVRLVLRRT